MKAKLITGELNWKEGKVRNFLSKELLNSESGTVKLVKIIPDAAYPLHNHPDKTEYCYVLQGLLFCKVGEESFAGTAGDFFIFPCTIQHALANHSDEDCIVLIGAIKI
ncbi:MAG: cupin domain-containing protein [Bacteroidetes bacterium]|nr:cupin domain-containing protein [Bacteroidota bacterium]